MTRNHRHPSLNGPVDDLVGLLYLRANKRRPPVRSSRVSRGVSHQGLRRSSVQVPSANRRRRRTLPHIPELMDFNEPTATNDVDSFYSSSSSVPVLRSGHSKCSKCGKLYKPQSAASDSTDTDTTYSQPQRFKRPSNTSSKQRRTARSKYGKFLKPQSAADDSTDSDSTSSHRQRSKRPSRSSNKRRRIAGTSSSSSGSDHEEFDTIKLFSRDLPSGSSVSTQMQLEESLASDDEGDEHEGVEKNDTPNGDHESDPEEQGPQEIENEDESNKEGEEGGEEQDGSEELNGVEEEQIVEEIPADTDSEHDEDDGSNNIRRVYLGHRRAFEDDDSADEEDLISIYMPPLQALFAEDGPIAEMIRERRIPDVDDLEACGDGHHNNSVIHFQLMVGQLNDADDADYDADIDVEVGSDDEDEEENANEDNNVVGENVPAEGPENRPDEDDNTSESDNETNNEQH